MLSNKWISVVAAVIFLASCFFPWLVIESKNLVISGVDATGTTWGKPGYMSLILISIYLIMTLIQTNWAHRTALFMGAINVAWILRTFFLLSSCQSGECPSRQPAFWVYLFTGILLLVLVLLRQVKPPKNANGPATA